MGARHSQQTDGEPSATPTGMNDDLTDATALPVEGMSRNSAQSIDAITGYTQLPTPAPTSLVVELVGMPAVAVYMICSFLSPLDVARVETCCKAMAAVAPVYNGLATLRPTRTLNHAGVVKVLSQIPKLRGLRVLDLSGAELNSDALREMAKLAAEGQCKALQTLSVFGNDLQSNGVMLLSKAIGNGYMPNLEGLYVMANQIEEEECICAHLAAGACPQLRRLSFAQNRLHDGLYLEKALASGHLGRLQKLDLHFNQLGDDGVTAVATGIMDAAGLPHLDELYLGYNDVGDKGVSRIADALPFLPALQELDLGNNRIGDEGVLALAFRLSLPQTPPSKLQIIDLRANRVGDAGACTLRDMLSPPGPPSSSVADVPHGDVDGAGEHCTPPPTPTHTHTHVSLRCICLDDNRGIRAAGMEALQQLRMRTGMSFGDFWGGPPGWDID